MSPRTLVILALCTLALACTDSHTGSDASVDSGADTTPPPADYTSCTVTSECTITGTECCLPCERPTIDDVAAVNASRRDAYFDEVACPEGPPPCPRCAVPPNPALVATCAAAAGGANCEVVDLENDPALAGCETNDDCFLRVPDCCECGASTAIDNLIALNRDGLSMISAIACDPEWTCAGCAPIYPPEASAACHPELGLCRVLIEGSEP